MDQEERVLLLLHSRPEDDEHWAPPGGGIDQGETAAQAATRELAEETGITGVPLSRPVWLWQHRFSRHGVQTEQHETLFVTRTTSLNLSDVGASLEEDGIVRSRWWTWEELSVSTEDVWPHGLAELLPGVLLGTLDPESPADLGFTVSRSQRDL